MIRTRHPLIVSLLATLCLMSSPLGAQKSPISDDSLRPNYVLGVGDQILVHALEMEEIGDRAMLIDGDGNINVPRLGIVKASGLSVAQLEAALVNLMRKYVREPQVTLIVTQYHSEPVFFEGSFQHPGLLALQGRRTLIEMITAVGGLTPNASRYITITRRKEIGTLPLPNAVTSADGQTMSVKISMASLRNDINPAENILLEPYDIVRAERAEPIYVDGAIVRIGGIDLVERDSMTLTELITLAGGLKPEADATRIRLLRPVMDTTKRSEISLNAERILKGKDADFPILPNDFLYVPVKPFYKQNIGKAITIIIPLAMTATILALRY